MMQKMEKNNKNIAKCTLKKRSIAKGTIKIAIFAINYRHSSATAENESWITLGFTATRLGTATAIQQKE